MCAERQIEVKVIPMSSHDPVYCAEDIEIWEVKRIGSFSPLARSVESADHFILESWGEQLFDITFQLNGKRHSIKQSTATGIGGSVWPSSIIASRYASFLFAYLNLV